jgi:hypothetical protein
VTDCPTETLVQAFREGRVVATNGPFLDLSLEPGETFTGAQTLDVKVLAPSWIAVDTLQLLKEGAVAQSVAGAEASFVLNPETDAVYHVLATGSSWMSPVVWDLPWALSGPIRLDAGGDGWTAPLPAFEGLEVPTPSPPAAPPPWPARPPRP